ncbi:thioredoxin family protein [Pollutibacter soli]|uniref:thioredoxin family protein n=1 Tax=Pollutibacter soli TaxID=3034157 RepID=UPI003013C22F
MILLKLLLPYVAWFHQEIWQLDFQKASSSAREQHKFILVNFSGSDWCGPCIKMHKDLFESDVFLDYARQKLVLVQADFPRLKKNALSGDQIKKNEALADQLNREGTFPLTVLLDANGKVVQRWEGNPGLKPEIFVQQIESFVNGSRG